MCGGGASPPVPPPMLPMQPPPPPPGPPRRRRLHRRRRGLAVRPARVPRLPGRRALGRTAAAAAAAARHAGAYDRGAGPGGGGGTGGSARAASEQKGARERGRGRPVGEGRIGEKEARREAPQPAGADARPVPTRRREGEPRGPAKSRPYAAAASRLRPGERGGGDGGAEGLLLFPAALQALTQSFSWPQAATYSSGRKQGLAKDGCKRPRASTQDLEAKVVFCYPRNGGQ